MNEMREINQMNQMREMNQMNELCMMKIAAT
jgi:hypothetical protein